MEETLGKRIALHRKRLGLTQDALAERLGVTAQAVSKWENDQSCPDITTVPKLAEIFGTTTDELLGVPPRQVHVAEVVAKETDTEEPDGIHLETNDWEFQWDGSRRDYLGLAVWVMLSGFLLFLTGEAGIAASLWEILWTSGLMLYGLFGILYPHFSFFRLACAFLGGYFLCTEVFGQSLDRDFILPVFLMCFGLSLFVKALKKPKKAQTRILRNGRSLQRGDLTLEADTFTCETSFGENSYLIQLPRLSGGSAAVSFGSMTLDLSGCEALAENCLVDASCSFGELTVLIPKQFRAEVQPSTAFGHVEQSGSPDPDSSALLRLACDASFGHILLRYI